MKKSELDEILDGLETLYGEQVVSTNLSAHQAGADRLAERIHQGIKHGRLRLFEADRIIPVARLDFEWYPKVRIGGTCRGEGCRNRRIRPGEAMYIARATSFRETMYLCESCGAPFFDRQDGQQRLS